jgi:hypothetical protein
MQRQILLNSLKITLIILSAIAVSMTDNFNQDIASSVADANPKTPSQNSATPKIETKRGKLIYKEIPPTRTVTAYQGSEFLLVTNPQSPRGLMLRTSEKVNRDRLKSFHNQQVEITAIYSPGTRPSGLESACPLDADGQCMIQGEGYRVLSIRAINRGKGKG